MPVTVACRGVLFDMDGILISSLGSVERSWTKWAQMRGVDAEYAIGVIHGRRAIDSLRMLRPDLDGEAELRILEDFEVEDVEGLVVLPGVRELIDALPEDRWTVVTSATERLARVRMAAGNVPVPKRLVTAEAVHEGKPSPAPYLAGAKLLGLQPEECVVFEDSASGVESGHRAGCVVIATTFSHEAEDLHRADYIVRDLGGVVVERRGDSIELGFVALGR
ncbi:MAG TPA: HAD-IA family hydrolase [Terracidiphilus sp.]|nr:HAD-IA family hydrolase [Terracidiphilus sp.]